MCVYQPCQICYLLYAKYRHVASDIAWYMNHTSTVRHLLYNRYTCTQRATSAVDRAWGQDTSALEPTLPPESIYTVLPARAATFAASLLVTRLAVTTSARASSDSLCVQKQNSKHNGQWALVCEGKTRQKQEPNKTSVVSLPCTRNRLLLLFRALYGSTSRSVEFVSLSQNSRAVVGKEGLLHCFLSVCEKKKEQQKQKQKLHSYHIQR